MFFLQEWQMNIKIQVDLTDLNNVKRMNMHCYNSAFRVFQNHNYFPSLSNADIKLYFRYTFYISGEFPCIYNIYK